MIHQAKWIWADIPCRDNQYVDFLTEFELGEIADQASLQICADAEYAVWLNGTFAGCGQYRGYPSVKYYDTIPVAQLLRPGKNRLCITGYYQGATGLQYAKGPDALCFALQNGETVILSDQTVLAAPSVTYQNGAVHRTTNQLGYGFVCDQSAEDDWCDPARPLPARFCPAVVRDVSTDLQPRPIARLQIDPPVRSRVVAQGCFVENREEPTAAARMQHAFLSYREAENFARGGLELPGALIFEKADGDGVWLVADLGREEYGFVTIELDVPADTAVDIGWGEHLNDLRVRSAIKSRCFANTFVCRGGRHRFTHYFSRIAGRYIQLHIHANENITVCDVSLLPVNYPFAAQASFRCNDTMHNLIYDTALHTLKLCMHEHYEDCPWREQSLYGSDSRNQMLCSHYAFGAYDYARASLALLGDSFDADGFQRITAPTDETLKIPSFSMIWFLAVREYTEFTGDDYLIHTYWETIGHAIGLYVDALCDGLAPLPLGENYWHFYEWSDEYDGFGKIKEFYGNPGFVDGMYQLFVMMAVQNALWLAERSGKTAFVARYKPVLAQMTDTFNRLFWDEERQLYAAYLLDGERLHYGELTQAIAAYIGVSDVQRTAVLCEKLCNPEGLVGITLSYSLYKYEVLLTQGGKYHQFVFDQIAHKWGSMLTQGATTFWEDSCGAEGFLRAGSLCHGWSAIPIYLYHRYALGITPGLLRGAAQFAAPQVNVFSRFEGRVPLAEGTVCVCKEEGKSPVCLREE